MREMIGNIKMNIPYKLAKADNFYILLPNAHDAYIQREVPDWSNYNPYKYGTKIFFRQDVNSNFKNYLILKKGWSFPEEKGIWTDGNNATFLINLPKKPDSNLILTIDSLPFLCLKHPMLTVNIIANNIYLGRLNYKLNDFSNIKTIEIPKKIITNDKTLKLEFIFEKSMAPSNVYASTDNRMLGLFFSWISFDEFK